MIDVDDAQPEAPTDLFVDEVPVADQPARWRWLWPVVAVALLAGVFWALRA